MLMMQFEHARNSGTCAHTSHLCDYLCCYAMLLQKLQVVVFVRLELRNIALILQKRDDALCICHALSKVVQHLWREQLTAHGVASYQ